MKKYVGYVDAFIVVNFETDAAPGTDEFDDACTTATNVTMEQLKTCGVGVSEYEMYEYPTEVTDET